MSTARERERERRRRARESARPAESAVSAQSSAPPADDTRYKPTPLPEWHWRTFPVYCALAFGLFIGVYLGVIASEVNDAGNNWPMLVLFIGVAIFLGFALSRLTTRWMMSRNWIKARPRKKT